MVNEDLYEKYRSKASVPEEPNSHFLRVVAGADVIDHDKIEKLTDKRLKCALTDFEHWANPGGSTYEKKKDIFCE